MDMAVGIIIGAAFTAIVKSMVGDLINPFIGLFMGGVDFTNMFFVLSGEGTYASLTESRDAGRGRFCIWRLYYGCDQFPDHRLCCVYVGTLSE
jgi:large conductance mechanosensitive channel